ncbi:hypothetical protein [Streptomyces sp. NBC_00233]|uniref:hypothetical protein n=1 Tax=Streptomyces sp. NBC_00233 TaxID=2975686 RepID=UPI00224CBF83|nr:hypothetical protein [Streptomyces sp. NBC_00233]MCX5232918.1 hypothetical protein [Streptomyces sp. NBC_00233]
MTGLWKYFEENHEIFAALVAFLAIGGGLLGSVIGAKIQANGGRDQAAAAREAAQTAAEAQRVAALWSVRQVQTAEFIRSVRELVWSSNRLFEVLDSDSQTQAEAARQALGLRVAEIELVVPRDVMTTAHAVYESAVQYWDLAWTASPLLSAERNLRLLAGSNDPETGRAALEAIRVLYDDGASHLARLGALTAVPGLPHHQVVLLVENRRDPEPSVWHQKDEAGRALNERMDELVTAARAMLRSEDDVAPAVPEQRRRWWPSGSGVVPPAP